MAGKKGTEIKSGDPDYYPFNTGGGGVDSKNLFEVTVAGKVLRGMEQTLHYSTESCRAPRTEITLMLDGLKKNDAFLASLDTRTGEIQTVPYQGTDPKTGEYKGAIQKLQNPALTQKMEAVWNAAVTLQPGETTPIITGEEAKALASVLNEIEDVANKIPNPKLASASAKAR